MSDLSKHKDGSGEIAIKLVHDNTKREFLLDVIRLIFSISLLIFSVITVCYAIINQATTMPQDFPHYIQFLALAIVLFGLGVLEGLQIAVVELAHKNPKQYAYAYPRAARLLAFENEGRNVERFLMGRQVLVVFFVFVAARVTTFEGFWHEAVHYVSFSGFLGVIVVVVIAQLTPQVLAAAYPVEFLNLYGMKIAFWACLIVESTGIVHAVWFLCVTVKKMVYNMLCVKHQRKMASSPQYSAVASTSSLEMAPTKTSTIQVNTAIVKAAKAAEDETYHTDSHSHDRQEWGNEHDALISSELDILKKAAHSRELFYIYGTGQYASPQQCYDKFTKVGLKAPQFLLPPENVQHIPPHIVALSLLKMYTEQVPQEITINDDN